MLISSISAVRPAAIMKPVHVRRILVIWLLLLHIFTLLWISLSSVISKPNILFPTRNILPACARRLLLICRESKKIPVTTSISPKKKWILYSHSVLLPMRSVNSLPVFFTQINNCLSFFPDFFLRLPVQIRHELHSLLFQYLLPESVP